MKIIISVGGRFHAFNLARQLLKRGFLERLITSYPKFKVRKYGLPPEKTKSIIIKEILFRFWNSLPGFLKRIFDLQFFIFELFDKLASKKIVKSDIFVGWSCFSLRCLRKAKKLGAVTIIERGSSHISYQDEILKEEYRSFGAKTAPTPRKVIEKELKEYEEADYISIPSSFVKRSFLEKGVPEKKLIQIPYGVDLSAFRQIPKKDGVFRVIFAGGMTLRKGVHYLLQAFSELKLPDSELVLIGSSNEEIKPFFKKYEGSYKYLGHIPQPELYKYFSQGSVFAMMSVEEGLALVIPQAMACGLPVVATVNTGAEDVVRDGKDGFVIPVRDTETLKEKLTFLRDNREICRQMGQSAKERVSSGFTWDDYGEKMVEAYRLALKNRHY